MSLRRLRQSRGCLTAGQKSAEGIIGSDVGKASEALRSRKAEQQIGRTGNGGRRPEREERQVGHESQERHAAEYPDSIWTSHPRQRVKPGRRGGKRSNRCWRRMNPKAQLTRIESMEEVCERENLKEALRRVKANKVAPASTA